MRQNNKFTFDCHKLRRLYKVSKRYSCCTGCHLSEYEEEDPELGRDSIELDISIRGVYYVVCHYFVDGLDSKNIKYRMYVHENGVLEDITDYKFDTDYEM